jgi:hypothetical protein
MPPPRPLATTCDEDMHKCYCKPKETCTAECGTEPDGCGGTVSCDTCTTGVCQPDQTCACTTCGARVCGTVPAEPNCAPPHCGDCASDRSCTAAGTCVCPTETEFCLGKECAVNYMSVSCGPYNCASCTSPETCGGGEDEDPFTCGCFDASDPCLAIECGTTTDMCNNTVECQCAGMLACSVSNTCVQPACVNCPTACCDLGDGAGFGCWPTCPEEL